MKGKRQRCGCDDQRHPCVFRNDGSVQVEHGYLFLFEALRSLNGERCSLCHGVYILQQKKNFNTDVVFLASHFLSSQSIVRCTLFVTKNRPWMDALSHNIVFEPICTTIRICVSIAYPTHTTMVTRVIAIRERLTTSPRITHYYSVFTKPEILDIRAIEVFTESTIAKLDEIVDKKANELSAEALKRDEETRIKISDIGLDLEFSNLLKPKLNTPPPPPINAAPARRRTSKPK